MADFRVVHCYDSLGERERWLHQAAVASLSSTSSSSSPQAVAGIRAAIPSTRHAATLTVGLDVTHMSSALRQPIRRANERGKLGTPWLIGLESAKRRREALPIAPLNPSLPVQLRRQKQ